MPISSNTQAVLLLTAHFYKANNAAVKPLTPNEWGRFAVWLKEKSLTPESLMTGRLSDLLNDWPDRTITHERVETLMNRGSALALAMEKWLRAGLWVMTRSDSDYPARLKQRLGPGSPAILFGCGNRALLNDGGLAVVGSRNAAKVDLAYSRELGALATKNGCSIISGGARGVDEASMLGALDAEGTVIGVLADSLLRASSSMKYRKHLMANNLVLISTSHPDAGFTVGQAMQRNKYIYCLSDTAIVVHSGVKGGTWSGAMENLKRQWVPLWVKKTSDTKAGNAAIVDSSAAWVSEVIRDVDFTSLLTTAQPSTASADDLFNQSASGINEQSVEHTGQQANQSVLEETEETTVNTSSVEIKSQNNEDISLQEHQEFYSLFLQNVQAVCSDSPKTVAELAETLELHTTQLTIWLQKAVSDKEIRKLTKPVRYEWITTQQNDLEL